MCKCIYAALLLTGYLLFSFAPLTLMLLAIFSPHGAWYWRLFAFIVGAQASVAGKPLSVLTGIDLKVL